MIANMYIEILVTIAFVQMPPFAMLMFTAGLEI